MKALFLRWVHDERGGAQVQYLMMLLVLAAGLFSLLRATGMGVSALWTNAHVLAALAGMVGLVMGVVVGVGLAGREPIENMLLQVARAGDWQMSHDVEVATSGSLELRVREDNTLGSWVVVGHCPRCGMPYFVNVVDLYMDDWEDDEDLRFSGLPHVWRTCTCFGPKRRTKKGKQRR